MKLLTELQYYEMLCFYQNKMPTILVTVSKNRYGLLIWVSLVH